MSETAPARHTICIWKTTARGEESVLWYSGPMRVTLQDTATQLIITVDRSGPEQEQGASGEGVDRRRESVEEEQGR
jgi:hypothetical protein